MPDPTPSVGVGGFAPLPPPPASAARRHAAVPPYGVPPRPAIDTNTVTFSATATQQTTRDPRYITVNQSALGKPIPWHMGPFIEGLAVFYAASFNSGMNLWLMGGICIGPIRSAQPFCDKVAMRLVSGSAINPNGTLYADSTGQVNLWLFDGSQTDLAASGLVAFDPLAAAEEIHPGLACAIVRVQQNSEGSVNQPAIEFHGEGYRLVFDPKDATFKYTENLALHVREIITNMTQGMAFASVDDGTDPGGFILAENDCDDPVFILVPDTAPTVVAGGAGSMEAGNYYFTWTAENADGIETAESPASAPFSTAGGGSATVTPGTGSAGTSARNVYRSVIFDAAATRYRVGRILNNTVGASVNCTMSNATALVQGAAPVNAPRAERYRGGISIANDATAQSYLDTVTGMCMGTLDMDAGKYQLRIDKPFPPGYVFTVLRELPDLSDPDNIIPANLDRTTVRTYLSEPVDQFNEAEVKYFDVANGFTPASVVVQRERVRLLLDQPKRATFNYDGIPDRNFANRRAITGLNRKFDNLLFEAQGTRSLIGLQQGDGVLLIAAGLSQQFRLNAPPEINEAGVFLRGAVYHAESYSNVVQNEDTPENGTVTSSNAPPPDPENIHIASRYTSNFPGYGETIEITFTPGVTPFYRGTRCVVDDGLTVRALPEQQTGPFVIPQPLRGATYKITLLTVTRFEKVSPGVTETYVPTYLPTVPDVLNLAAPSQTLEQRGTITFDGPDYPFTSHVDIYDISYDIPQKVTTVMPSQFGSPIDCRIAIHGDGYTKPQTFAVEAFVVSSSNNETSPGVPISWSIPVTGIASYTVGNDPRDIIMDSAGYLWITCYAGGTIQKLDRATGGVIATVTVGTKPYGITFGSGSVWVTVGAIGGTSAVKRVDPIGLTVTNTITLTSGSDPTGIIHDGTNVWVSAYSRNEVVRISPASNTITATVSVDTHPCLLYSLGAYIYVSCFGASTVNVLNASGVVAVIPVGAGPFGLASDSNGYLWCTNYAGNSISKINPGSNTEVLRLPLSSQGGPVDCAFGSGEVWVTEAITRQALKINISTNSVRAWVPLPSSPRSIIYDGREFWTPNNLNAASALVPITAVNPAPGGGTSNAVSFVVVGLDVSPLPS